MSRLTLSVLALCALLDAGCSHFSAAGAIQPLTAALVASTVSGGNVLGGAAPGKQSTAELRPQPKNGSSPHQREGKALGRVLKEKVPRVERAPREVSKATKLLASIQNTISILSVDIQTTIGTRGKSGKLEKLGKMGKVGGNRGTRARDPQQPQQG